MTFLILRGSFLSQRQLESQQRLDVTFKIVKNLHTIDTDMVSFRICHLSRGMSNREKDDFMIAFCNCQWQNETIARLKSERNLHHACNTHYIQINTKLLVSPSPSSPPYQRHQQSLYQQRLLHPFLKNQEDTLQIKILFFDVQYTLGFEASKEQLECTSLVFSKCKHCKALNKVSKREREINR